MPDFSEECIECLRLLKDRHNVLISGAPGTGKSRLLNEVARAFTANPKSGPVHVPGSDVAIPRNPPISIQVRALLPSPACTNRKVFRTVFHQNSKHREFITGIVPVIGSRAGGNAASFKVVSGTLFRASEHARSDSGASLLIIDEINRGPAVQVFGGSIVAIESDKRLKPDGTAGSETQFFETLHPEAGDIVEYALPHDLYLLAAMNQADTSVEPLDVAFLRRWCPLKLEPDVNVLRSYFGLSSSTSTAELPATPTSASEVYEASTLAWSAVNSRIALGRGAEFQIGHGVLMAGSIGSSTSDALRDTAESWTLIRAHIDEVFFGDVRGAAAVLNASSGVAGHPFRLVDSSFADEPRYDLEGPSVVSADQIYSLLRAIVS